jgi:hypothetical protein
VIYYSGFRWCLHKDHGLWHDITRFMDEFRVFLAECGGIRTEERT